MPASATDTSVSGSRTVDPGSQSDAALLFRVAAGDVSAFDVFHDRHCEPALALAVRVCGRRALAEDVTQEAFIIIWQLADSYVDTRGCARNWLLTIVHHRAIDALRREGREARPRVGHGVVAHGAATAPTESLAMSSCQRDDTGRLMRGLPVSQRQVIALAFYGGLTQSEISQHLGCPLGTVKSRMRAGLAQLREALGGEAAVA